MGSVPITKEKVTEKTPASCIILGKPLDREMVQYFLPRVGLEDILLFHWMAFFVFEDPEDPDYPECRMAELDVEEDHNKKKIIKGKFTKMDPIYIKDLLDNHGWKVVQQKAQFTNSLSPAEVFKATMSSPMNGKEYDPVNYNCQHWVKRLCNQFNYCITAQDLGEAGGWVHIGVQAVRDYPAKLGQKLGEKKGKTSKLE